MSRAEAAYLALILGFYLVFAASLARAALEDARRGRPIRHRDDPDPPAVH